MNDKKLHEQRLRHVMRGVGFQAFHGEPTTELGQLITQEPAMDEKEELRKINDQGLRS